MAWIIRMMRLFLFKRKWRRLNKHNSTYPLDLFPINTVEIGNYSYGGLRVLTFGEGYKVYVGHCCSIGPNVLFVLKAEHPVDRISTFPFKVKVLGESYEAMSKGDIILDDDVWVGANVTIMSGVHVGQGAIIAAGAVVTSDVPPYAIVGGVPSKVIRYRFDENTVQKLVNIDYSSLKFDSIRDNIELLYTPVTENNVQDIINRLFL